MRSLSAPAFDDWGLHRIEIRAAIDNMRSRVVAERCGFAFEGVKRGAELVGGVYSDHAVYGRLVDDEPRQQPVRGRDYVLR